MENIIEKKKKRQPPLLKDDEKIKILWSRQKKACIGLVALAGSEWSPFSNLPVVYFPAAMFIIVI